MTTFGPAQVSASADDAFENAAGTVTTNGAAIGALTTGNMWAGVRIQNVTIPNAATVSAPTPLEFYVNSTATDDLIFNVYAQAIDDAPTFTTGANDVSSRSRSTAFAAVSASAVGVGWYSVDVATVVHEIVNRPGWVSGNDIAFIVDGLAGVNFQFRAYDGNPAEAVKLTVTYTAASTAANLLGGKIAGRLLRGKL